MSIYSNDNISKIEKLTPRELLHLAKTAKITVRENNGVYSILINKMKNIVNNFWGRKHYDVGCRETQCDKNAYILKVLKNMYVRIAELHNGNISANQAVGA